MGQRQATSRLNLGNALRARTSWRSISSAITTATVQAGVSSADSTRGYFWSSMLAAISSAGAGTAWPPSASQIVAVSQVAPTPAPGTRDRANGEPVCARMLSPRAKSPRLIAEVGVPAAVDLAANTIADALAATHLPSGEAQLVLQVVGVTVSPDL